MATLMEICSGLPVNRLPPAKQRDESVPHAPVRVHNLNQSEQKVSNTLQTFIQLDFELKMSEKTAEITSQ